MTDETPMETHLAVCQTLVTVAEQEVAKLGQEPVCSVMALIGAIQVALIKHGALPEAAASLLEIGFSLLGIRVAANTVVRQVTAVRDELQQTAAALATKH